MRSRIIVLLAVCSNGAVAGILRYNGAPAQHQNAARFLNHTAIPSIPPDIQTLTPVLISSSSSIPSIAASPETSIFAATSSTISTSAPLMPNVPSSSAADLLPMSTLNQVFSTSATLPTSISTAVGSEHAEAVSAATATSSEATIIQPSETLSRLFNLVGTPLNDLQSSANAPSFSSTSSPTSSAISSMIPNVPSTASIQQATYTTSSSSSSSSSSTANQALLSFEKPLTTSSTAGASQAMSGFTRPVPTSSLDAASQAPSPVVVPVPISSGPVQILGAGGDTADEFSPVTLNSGGLPAPTGTAKYPTAESGNTAMAAGFNSVYKTLNEDSPCNPSDPSQAYACVDGEIAECQSDQTYVLKSCPQGQSCYALPKPSGSTGVVVQCAVPSDAYSILAGLSSSTAVPVAATSQPAQLLQAEGGFTQTTQSVDAQKSVQLVTSSPAAQVTVQSQALPPTPSVQAVISTPLQAQSSIRLDKPAVPASTSSTSVQSYSQIASKALDPSVPLMTATAQQVHDSNPVDKSPESDSSPSAPSTTASVLSIPQAMFGVVTAPENDQASSSDRSNQATTPVIQSAALSQQTDPTSTSSADDTGITPAPTGVLINEKVAVGNGQATVTVTVTVTTTERPAPVTEVAS